MEEKKLYIWRFLMIALLSSLSFAASKKLLVSFSMPEKLLEATLKDCARHQIPAVLNGLYHDSMEETLNKMGGYASAIPELAMQIDPTVFDKYQIKQVPALIWEEKDCADIVYGNLSLDLMFEKIKSHGQCQKQGAHHA